MSQAFSFPIEAEQLIAGLRPSKRVPRNAKYLTESKGALGRDGALSSIDELTRIATTEITDGFPFPQIFVFTTMIIVCSKTKIYEWVVGALVEKLVVSAGYTWSAVDFYEYVYMSNGKVAVIRDSGTRAYSITTDLPTANAILNYNGQVIIGAPDIEIPGAGTIISADVLSLTITQRGSWS